MKYSLSMFLFCLASLGLQAQVRCTLVAGPVGADWKLSAKLTVAIEPGWHIASLTQPDGGPVRTEIALAEGQPFKLAGPIQGPKPRVEPSEAFGIDVETYEGTLVFTLPLVVTEEVSEDKTRARPLTVEITYQACTDETCLLPKTERIPAQVRGGDR
jgi:suppressor for copper-sensitivity B